MSHCFCVCVCVPTSSESLLYLPFFSSLFVIVFFAKYCLFYKGQSSYCSPYFLLSPFTFSYCHKQIIHANIFMIMHAFIAIQFSKTVTVQGTLSSRLRVFLEAGLHLCKYCLVLPKLCNWMCMTRISSCLQYVVFSLLFLSYLYVLVRMFVCLCYCMLNSVSEFFSSLLLSSLLLSLFLKT